MTGYDEAITKAENNRLSQETSLFPKPTQLQHHPTLLEKATWDQTSSRTAANQPDISETPSHCIVTNTPDESH